jgi:hypothetical protein
MMIKRAVSLMLFMFAAGLPLAGCMSYTHTFEGQDAQQVWSALVAVAETPNYDSDDPQQRWLVKENHVWVDEGEARIEIYRELDRVLHRPGAKPERQQRTWRFNVELESQNPPVAVFFCRDYVVPVRVEREADRYFLEVWEILVGAPAAPPAADQPPADDTPAEPDLPVVDVDELEPVDGDG